MNRLILSSAALAAFAVAGCAGGGGAMRVPSQPSAPAAPAQGQNRATTTVVVKLDGTSTASAQRRTSALSARTQGILVYVFPAGGTKPTAPTAAFNVSTYSSTCTANADGTRSCALIFPAPIGNDTIEFDAYDYPPYTTASGITANGSMLSSGSLTVNVTASPAPITVTMNGVVANVAFAYAGTVPAYAIGQTATSSVALTFTDAGGTPIVGTFANTVTVQSNNAAVTIAPPGGTAAASLTLTSAPSAAITVAYSGAVISGATLAANSGGNVLGQIKIDPAAGLAPPDGTLSFYQSTSTYSVTAAPNVNGTPPPPAPSSSPSYYGGSFVQVDSSNQTYNGVSNLLLSKQTFNDGSAPSSQAESDSYLQYVAGAGGVTNVFAPFFTYVTNDPGYTENDTYAYPNQQFDVIPETAGANFSVDLTRSSGYTAVIAPGPSPSPSAEIRETQTFNRARDGSFTRTTTAFYQSGQQGTRADTQNADASGSRVTTDPYSGNSTVTYGPYTGGNQSRTDASGTTTVAVPLPSAYASAPLTRSSVTYSAVSTSTPAPCYAQSGLPAATVQRDQVSTVWVPIAQRFIVYSQTDYVAPAVGSVCTRLVSQQGRYDAAGNWTTYVTLQYVTLNGASVQAAKRRIKSGVPLMAAAPHPLVGSRRVIDDPDRLR